MNRMPNRKIQNGVYKHHSGIHSTLPSRLVDILLPVLFGALAVFMVVGVAMLYAMAVGVK